MTAFEELDDEGRKRKGKDKDKDKAERVYSGSKTPDDLAFAEWINRQWARGEKLEKIDVIEYWGRTKGLGEIAAFEIFPSAHAVNVEEAVELSNRFIGAVQLAVDRIHKKPTRYYARAFDRGRGAEAVDTFPLDIVPKKKYADIVDDDIEQSPQRVALEYLREGIQAYTRDREREDENVGDLLAMFLSERREQRDYERQLQEQARALLADVIRVTLESAKAMGAMLKDEEGRRLDREITQLKIDGLREGARFGKNILTSLIGGGEVNVKSLPENAPRPNGERTVLVKELTKERMLIDQFFRDCKTTQVEDALFGVWAKDGRGFVQQTKPGIFTVDQFMILGAVHSGHATADALDDLLADSGKPTAITLKQFADAQVIMRESVAISLRQLYQMRMDAKAARTLPANAPSFPPEGKTDADGKTDLDPSA